MAHLLMLHGHPVGYLPPTAASEILYDNNTNVKEKIDEVDSKFIKFTSLSQPSNIPTTPTSYNCNWQNYDVLSFELCRYSNVRANIIVSKAYFSTTDSGGRVMIASNTGMEVSIWQNGQGSIMANANSQASDWNVKVWGISLATN